MAGLFPHRSCRSLKRFYTFITFRIYFQINQKELIKIRKFLEIKNNQNALYQNWQDVDKTVLRDKFVALNSYIKKKKKEKNELRIQFKKSSGKTNSLNNLKES